MILAAGIHAGISSERYHADPCEAPSLSSTVGKVLIDRSPRHAWQMHPKLNPECEREDSSRFDLGTAAHALLLEGLDKMCVIDPADHPAKNGNIPDGWTNNAIKAARDAARLEGKLPILKPVANQIRLMVEIAHEAIAKCKDLGGITLADGKAEQTVIWQESNGVWCRCRPDWMHNEQPIILDYKTSASAEPEWFSRQVGKMSYDFQASFYQRGTEALSGVRPQFILIAQEIEPPYAITFHGCAPSLRDIADLRVDRAITKWGECLHSNEWPAYTENICWTEATSWQMTKHEELLMEQE